MMHAAAQPVTLVPVGDDRLGMLGAALDAEHLPRDDIAEPGRLFFELRDRDGASLGWGGLEPYGPVGLLRSVVVTGARRRGTGRALVAALEAEAARGGVSDLFLLTITAKKVFAALGYTAAARATVPEAIRQTRQFTGLCPSVATVLTKRLAP